MNDLFEEQFGPEADLTASRNVQNRSRQGDEEGQLTVDVYQNEDDIIVKSTIAGVTADDMDISITNDMVTIKGNRKPDEKIKQSDFYYQELYWGPFSRSIILPEEIDADNAKASMKNGILTLRLPKISRSKIKKVKIKA